jgi:hypothetical protein
MKPAILSSLFILQLFALSYTAAAQDIGSIGNQKPFTINGQFGIGLGTYTSSGIPARERGFSYIFNGSPTINLYGISFPFSIVVSDQQRGFRQPFNQYGISPTYKWITVHAGWQSIIWSPFTMAGYNMLGGGVELNPGKVRFGFVYGRFNKAIEPDAAQQNSFFQTPAYRRTGYSTKLGFGTERNHLDVSFLNAKDDINSITNNPLVTHLAPAANMVLGISSKWSFLQHFMWDFDIAGSIYTRNLLADTLEGTELGQIALIRKFIPINSSSQFLTAAETHLGYQNKNYNVRLQYRRIDPDYKSMGAYYFETDVANYTAEGGINLMKNRLQLNGSLGFQNDNLLNDKSVTSHRNISSLSAAYNVAKYGVNVRYSNYGITQDRGLNPLIDTFRVARTNYNFNAMLRYSVSDERLSNNFILVGNLQSLIDLNRFTAAQNKTNSKTGNVSYQLGFLKSAFSINANYSYTVADVPLMHTIIYGPSVGVSKQLDKGKLNLSASLSYQQQKNNYKDAGTVLNGILNGSFRFTNRDAATLSFIYLKSNSKDITLPSFNEERTIFNLTHAF